MRINTSGMDPKTASAMREIERAITKLEQSGRATPLAPDMMQIPTEREVNPKGPSVRWNEEDSSLEIYHPGRKTWVKTVMEG